MIQKTHYIKVDLNSNRISKILKNYGIQQGNKTTKVFVRSEHAFHRRNTLTNH